MERIVSARQLAPGMLIVERDGTRKKVVAVKRVEIRPVGCRTAVHINGNACYGENESVTVTDN